MTWLLGYVDVFLSALVIALVIRTLVVEPFKIPSSSMEDTLLIGDHLFVNRFLYGWRVPGLKSRPLSLRQPKRGDIVVFIPPQRRDTDFIKRVVGTPGDKVRIRNQKVWVNGKELVEPYVVHKDRRTFMQASVPRDNMAEFEVPAGRYFMMGDNRDFSDDSRFWGFASVLDFKGKAMIIYWSWDSNPGVPIYDLIHKIRWRRMFRIVR
jgi:signal peptidase I